MSNPAQSFDSRRATIYNRQPEELHIPSGASANSTLPHQSMSHESSVAADTGMNNLPSINVQPSSSQPGHYAAGSSTGGASLPGALQPGNVNRPPAISMNTAPSVLPTLPQLSTQLQPQQSQSQPQQQQPPTTPRSGMVNSHGHSRSSPSNLEQPKYKPHGASEISRYGASPGAGFPPHTPQGSKYSPLGLADIRPSGDLLSDAITSPGMPAYNGETQVPTNGNYVAPWPIYAVDWCKWPITGNSGSFAGKIALGSYLEDNHNYIQIIDTHLAQPDPDTPDVAPGDLKLEYVKTAEATHSYPVTRILWEPPSSQKQSTDLLATSGDHLRLWSLPTTQPLHSSNSITRPANHRDPPTAKLSPLALLSNSKSPEHTAPITSLDWNTISPSLIITSSIDTTCTIWDIPTLTAKTQLIAHDKEVYDVRFCANSVDVFVSCGADGSVRMFDLRSLEHSTIIYEPTEKNDKLMSPGNGSPPASSQAVWPPPLLRIAASPHDAHLLATFSQDSNIVRVLDVRQPGQAILELKGHAAAINCVEWSLTRRGVLASGADDCCVLLWDLINQHNAAPVPSAPNAPGTPSTTSERGPAAAWQCDYEVSNISWSPQGGTNSSGHPRDWLGVCGGRGVWGVAL
ncbi:WD repeat protein [Aspergillus clavatus NRRL 1]|uniref:WD repeat protein n=1 Tax=Aspergillus clavatus (strain ATCC 1007 / CBS 513.65 / DSM 816 / NCTC 3887 / NRRL 1 / QM 1276 / 107) TaxID=344612 RepID=A1CHG5_ASPCL|nr:WD repeat protein [Aspergillus clavatus NRRL 1]EAW10320.1 WD repeat protein [Aspergillus clavatus NRRL 1]